MNCGDMDVRVGGPKFPHSSLAGCNNGKTWALAVYVKNHAGDSWNGCKFLKFTFWVVRGVEFIYFPRDSRVHMPVRRFNTCSCLNLEDASSMVRVCISVHDIVEFYISSNFLKTSFHLNET